MNGCDSTEIMNNYFLYIFYVKSRSYMYNRILASQYGNGFHWHSWDRPQRCSSNQWFSITGTRSYWSDLNCVFHIGQWSGLQMEGRRRVFLGWYEGFQCLTIASSSRKVNRSWCVRKCGSKQTINIHPVFRFDLVLVRVRFNESREDWIDLDPA